MSRVKSHTQDMTYVMSCVKSLIWYVFPTTEGKPMAGYGCPGTIVIIYARMGERFLSCGAAELQRAQDGRGGAVWY